MTLDTMIAELSTLNFYEPFFLACIAFVFFNPIYWNVVARVEHKNKTITKMTGKSPADCCHMFALTVFSLGLIRDTLYFSKSCP